MYNNPEILSFNSSHLMLRILSQDNLDHRGGFLKPLNKTHILQNKYLDTIGANHPTMDNTNT